MREEQSIPMKFTKNINITRDLVEKYGKTEGYYGCRFAMREISYIKGHNDVCRKRFLELSEKPGYEDLKERLDKSIERATRKWLETEEQGEPQTNDKRVKTEKIEKQIEEHTKEQTEK